MPPPATAASAVSLLPALSVVLGLPLCLNSHPPPPPPPPAGAIGGSGRDGSAASSSAVPDAKSSSPSAAPATTAPATKRGQRSKYREDFAARARDNVSRIYARRVIDRARLERRQNSPAAAAAAAPSNNSAAAAAPSPRRRLKSPKDETEEIRQSWKDDLLAETLASLLKLQEKLERAKSLTGNPVGGGNSTIPFLSQLGITIGNTVDTTANLSFLPRNNNTAHCESATSLLQKRTLNEYNSLASSKSSPSAGKPAEWSEDINLVQRRHEFGREISPLSHTTRLERWGMACRRVVTLGALAAPLGAMVPLNLLLGRFAGAGARTPSDADGASGGSGRPAAANSGGDRGPSPSSPPPSALQRCHRSLTAATWDYALWAIETAGPTYIKLVQWASTRNDLFSPAFVGHFAKLQDETRGHTWKETEATLERAYGREWRTMLSFDEVIGDGVGEADGEEDGDSLRRKGGRANRERQVRLSGRNGEAAAAPSSSAPTIPIGSGCVAQVYKARLTSHHGLHPPGTSVAVKVQHPRILEKVCLDFYIFHKLAAALELIPRLNLDYLSMKDSVDQFRDIMLPQLDLRVEAQNLQRFRRDFEGETRIAFPEPLMGLTSREVLVERFVEGEPMLNYVLRKDESHSKEDREELATIGLETVMKMIFLHDFVHADLHPGNMIVDRNKSVRGSPLRVTMIDCGLTVELGERDHVNLVKILGSLIKRDGHAAGALMVDTAKKCQATELDVEMFCKGMEKICIDDEENNFLESVGDYITDICYLACRHKVKLEAAFINAAVACEIMEGLASSLYPNMKVQSVALPLVVKAEMMHGLNKFWS